jgi:hypothetical protein
MLLYPVRLVGTTVVVLITNNGVVVSSDSKTKLHHPDFSDAGDKQQTKFVIVQKRIVVAAIGVSDMRDGALHYNFLDWMQELERKIVNNISVEDLANRIEKESLATFSRFDLSSSIKVRASRQGPVAEPCELFAQFVITGYQSGVPRVYRVQFDIDWNSQRFIGPTVTLIYPDSAQSNYRVIRFGTQQAIQDVFLEKSYAHRQATVMCPQTMAHIVALTEPSLDETVCLSRALIQVEENTNPAEVGGRIRTVRILPSGVAEESKPARSSSNKSSARQAPR